MFFQHGHVVQIEASSDRFHMANGLSTGRPATAWQTRYPAATRLEHTWPATNPEMGSPACKHVLVYGDAVAAGIAWKSGAWGCAAPEPDPNAAPESVIVHRPGQPVQLNPNDADDYAGTGR